jgi:hypothetical protein
MRAFHAAIVRPACPAVFSSGLLNFGGDTTTDREI